MLSASYAQRLPSERWQEGLPATFQCERRAEWEVLSTQVKQDKVPINLSSPVQRYCLLQLRQEQGNKGQVRRLKGAARGRRATKANASPRHHDARDQPWYQASQANRPVQGDRTREGAPKFAPRCKGTGRCYHIKRCREERRKRAAQRPT